MNYRSTAAGTVNIAMKHLNHSFGVQVDQEQIQDTSQLLSLIDAHKIVVIENAKIDSEQDLINFATKIGKTFPQVSYYDIAPDIKLDFYKNNNIGVDDLTIQTKSGLIDSIDIEDWHQDAASYHHTKMIGCAHVKSPAAESECIGDTAFCNLQGIYHSLSDSFKSFLKTLTIEHSSLFYREQDYFISKTLQTALKSNNIKEVIMSLVKLKNYTPKPFVNKFINDDGCINFSPKDSPRFLDLTPAESNIICDLLKKQITNPIWQYQHRWNNNQIVLWDNRYVLHRRIDNAGINTTRTFWRIQIEI